MAWPHRQILVARIIRVVADGHPNVVLTTIGHHQSDNAKVFSKALVSPMYENGLLHFWRDHTAQKVRLRAHTNLGISSLLYLRISIYRTSGNHHTSSQETRQQTNATIGHRHACAIVCGLKETTLALSRAVQCPADELRPQPVSPICFLEPYPPPAASATP